MVTVKLMSKRAWFPEVKFEDVQIIYKFRQNSMNYKQILKNLGNIVLPINTFGFGFNSGSFLFFLYKSTNKRLGEETG